MSRGGVAKEYERIGNERRREERRARRDEKAKTRIKEVGDRETN